MPSLPSWPASSIKASIAKLTACFPQLGVTTGIRTKAFTKITKSVAMFTVFVVTLVTALSFGLRLLATRETYRAHMNCFLTSVTY